MSEPTLTPHTITTVEELEALPEGTFLRIAGWVYLLHEGKWYLVNTRDMTLGTQSVLGGRIGLNHIGLRHHLPATVLTAQPTISAEQVRTEAERRWPDNTNSMGLNAERAWRQRAFIQGAKFALGLTVAGESQ